MVETATLSKIQALTAEVNAKRDILADYDLKLANAKADLEQAEEDRGASFSFETDSKVVNLESFVSRIERRYVELKQEFETELPKKLREVEELYHKYVIEKWNLDPEVQLLTQQTVEKFKESVALLSQYTEKPAQFSKVTLNDVMTADFKKAFSGQMTFMGAGDDVIANAVPLDYGTYQKLYSAARQLGATLD